jgi:DNA-binding NarL/FixJ family response regulator
MDHHLRSCITSKKEAKETVVPEEEQENAHSCEINDSSSSCLTPMLAKPLGPIGRDGPNEVGLRSQPSSYWVRGADEVVFVGLVDQHAFTRECIANFLQGLGRTFEVMSFTRCQDCRESLRHHDVILYHRNRALKNQKDDGQRSADLKILVEIAPVIILSAADCPNAILEAFRSGVSGFIPTVSTTPKQVIEIIRLVKAGGTFVPLNCLPIQRVNASSLATTPVTVDEFTPRELAVLDGLMLGKANKIIAYELRISESTVKIRIKSIMNKLKAKNRTEVVCRAYDLAASEALVQGRLTVEMSSGPQTG